MTISPNQYSAIQSMAADRATAELASAFREHDVSWLLLKGPSVASRLYTDSVQRHYRDVDALIAPEDFGKAERVLEGLAYEPSPYSSRQYLEHDSPWVRSDGSVIDLHRTFTHLAREQESVWQVVSEEAATIDVAGETVLVPKEATLAALVALHALGDAPKFDKSLTDLERACEQLSIETWHEAGAVAARLGADRNLAAALQLTPKGSGVSRMLALPHLSRWESFLRTGGRRDMGVLVARIASAPGWLSKIRLISELIGSTRLKTIEASRRGSLSVGQRIVKGVIRLPLAIASWWVQRHDLRDLHRFAAEPP